MSLQRWPITVVGGGVVGLAAAQALTAAGFDVGVIEQGPSPVADAHDLRMYAIAPGAAQALPAGVLDDPAHQVFTDMQVWHAERAGALRFTAAEARAPALGWIAPESVLRQALWAALPTHRCWSGASVVDLTHHDDGLSLMLDDGRVVRSQLVVACDGARSPMRARAGIDVHAWSYPARGLVADIRAGQPHAQTCWQRFLPDSVVALLPRQGGHYSLVWSTPEADALAALDDAAFGAALTAAFGGELGALDVCSPRRLFPLSAQHAEAYVAGRIVLVGDAAHTVHPLAGQGVNLGLGDALELVSVLRQARDAGRDWTQPRVLARYQRARRAANAEMIALTDALSRGFAPGIPGLSDVLDQGLRWVNQLTPVKALLIRRAMGLTQN
ncbi:MAG: 2-octaprenyl-3-methyl-6-methoxy-1,4-benzoquinol hydroxylase [Polycyclovorans sp.]|nr:2-octaprenyl-3-methyl-6-methoxy-1,4-benzoquinol hydroxylase [Polycyclovorans sp.]|tara:strand:+ start:22545 stop:23699 length:1155 start_codon:yes stop_codon:yes gene_type:complete